MNLTFRAWLTIRYVATLALLLLLLAAGGFYALDRIAQRKFDTALGMLGVAEAEGIAARLIERGIERPDQKTIIDSRYQEMLGYNDARLEKYLMVIDDQRQVADLSANLAAPLPVEEALLARCFNGETVLQTTDVQDVGSLRIVYIPVRGALISHPFIVLVGLPESIVGSEVRRIKIIVVLAFITLVLLTSASALMLADRAISPIEKITAAAEAINSNNLRARLPEPRSGDQISRLTGVFNRMIARLENSFKTERLFTAGVAHELRTPLTILKGEAQVALRQQRTVEEYEELLNSSLEEIDKLVKIIDDLLLLARYETGDARVLQETVRLDEIVKNAVADLRPLAAQKNMDMQLEVQPTALEGEPKMLKRLICILTENALHYTPYGGRVRIRLSRQAAQIELIVEDSGIGIKPEEQESVFQRFFRSTAARQMRPEGSGIGLALSTVIAKLHGATLSLESEAGVGTRFTVCFLPGSQPAIHQDEIIHAGTVAD